MPARCCFGRPSACQIPASPKTQKPNIRKPFHRYDSPESPTRFPEDPFFVSDAVAIPEKHFRQDRDYFRAELRLELPDLVKRDNMFLRDPVALEKVSGTARKAWPGG